MRSDREASQSFEIVRAFALNSTRLFPRHDKRERTYRRARKRVRLRSTNSTREHSSRSAVEHNPQGKRDIVGSDSADVLRVLSCSCEHAAANEVRARSGALASSLRLWLGLQHPEGKSTLARANGVLRTTATNGRVTRCGERVCANAHSLSLEWFVPEPAEPL